MPYANLKEVLESARRGGYAVGSFNAVSIEFANAILDAAEAEKSPVIISVAEAHFPYVDIAQIAPVIRARAEGTDVPVVLHLDHGESLETAIRALSGGFSGIMIDLSRLPYEENLSETRQLVRFAHALGVSVEAELGEIGGGGEGIYLPSEANPDLFTDPVQAAEFVRRTGIDALAVSVGNVHGFYRGEPRLDFGLIERLGKEISVPLVLHGGSGISDDDFRRAIRLGMCKINFYTGMSERASQRVRELLSGKDEEAGNGSFLGLERILSAALQAVTEVVAERMRVFGSSGKA